MSENILEISNLKMHFPKSKGFFIQKEYERVRAVDGITLNLKRGETLGVVGESGCGKSTFGRCLMRLWKPTEGSIKLDGQEIATLDEDGLKTVRPKIQMIFQDPYASLNPRMTVFDIIAEPLITHKICTEKEELERKVSELMKLVGLSPRFVKKYPHEFSGGQRQRIAIARAIAISPEVIVCDEPVSALDVSIQAQIINLLIKLKTELNLTLIFIAHDLSVVRHISDRVAVMYLGKVCEVADVDEVFENPKHPYTQALLSAVPLPDPKKEKERKRITLGGDLPSPLNPPSGCSFHTRCPVADSKCASLVPKSSEISKSHLAYCHKI
jgi:oligopeptide/dipeptide ABC transporter ATP-binding protein